MTASDGTGDTEGLTIVGEVSVGFPAQMTGYGGLTYGNTQPSAELATWLVLYRDTRDGTARTSAADALYKATRCGSRWANSSGISVFPQK